MDLLGKGIVARVGGKSRLQQRIVNNYFPQNYEDLIYIEPFVGGGSIFFYKNNSKKDIINDLDKNLISVYKGFKKYDAEEIHQNIFQHFFEIYRQSWI